MDKICIPIPTMQKIVSNFWSFNFSIPLKNLNQKKKKKQK